MVKFIKISDVIMLVSMFGVNSPEDNLKYEVVVLSEIKYFIKKGLPLYVEKDGEFVPTKIYISKKWNSFFSHSPNFGKIGNPVKVRLDEDVIELGYLKESRKLKILSREISPGPKDQPSFQRRQRQRTGRFSRSRKIPCTS